MSLSDIPSPNHFVVCVLIVIARTPIELIVKFKIKDQDGNTEANPDQASSVDVTEYRLQSFGQLVSSNFAPTMEFCTDDGDVLIVLCSFVLVQIRVRGERRGPAAGGLRYCLLRL